jgi:hypothetical protein
MGMLVKDNETAGTFVFDDYPTYDEWYAPFKYLEGKPAKEMDMMTLAEPHFSHLPVWCSGNAYFNGAKPWKKEKDNFVDTEHKITFEIEEDKDGHPILKTNLYQYLSDFRDGIITTDTLGEAFEPEERFETPEGKDITFDDDYLGEHRGVSTIPGPFAAGEDAEKELW